MKLKKKSLDKHVKSRHTQEGLDKETCPHCGYQSTTRARMKHHLWEKHQDVSLGDVRMYKCQYCEYTQISRNSVEEHVKNVHEIKLGRKSFNIIEKFELPK